MLTQVIKGKRALWYPARKSTGEARRFALFLPGFPKYPSKSKFTEIFLEFGYDVLVPMYSGTFDSDGGFSIEESIEDARLWYSFLQEGVFFVSPEKKESLKVSEIIIFSSSFGSLVAGLALKKYPFESIRKCFFVSPLWDTETYKLEDAQNSQANETARLMDFSYPHSYRFENKEDFFGKLSGAVAIAGANEKFLDETKEFHIFSGKQDAVTPTTMAESLAASYTPSFLHTLDGGHSSRIDMDAFKKIMASVCSNQQG